MPRERAEDVRRSRARAREVRWVSDRIAYLDDPSLQLQGAGALLLCHAPALCREGDAVHCPRKMNTVTREKRRSYNFHVKRDPQFLVRRVRRILDAFE